MLTSVRTPCNWDLLQAAASLMKAKNVLNFGYSHESSVVIIILYSFSRTNAGCPSGPQKLLVLSLINSTKHKFYFVKQALNPRSVVGYSHNVHATIAQWLCLAMSDVMVAFRFQLGEMDNFPPPGWYAQHLQQWKLGSKDETSRRAPAWYLHFYDSNMLSLHQQRFTVKFWKVTKSNSMCSGSGGGVTIYGNPEANSL